MIGRPATAAYSLRAISRVRGSTGRSRSASRARGRAVASVVMSDIVRLLRAGAHELPRVAGALVDAGGRGESGSMTTTAPTPIVAPGPPDETPHQAARRAVRLGGVEGVLAPDAVEAFVAEQLAAADLDGRSVCIVVPDGTRTCPLPLLVGAVHRALHG